MTTRKPVVNVTVTGRPGCGKTTVAYILAHALAEHKIGCSITDDNVIDSLESTRRQQCALSLSRSQLLVNIKCKNTHR